MARVLIRRGTVVARSRHDQAGVRESLRPARVLDSLNQPATASWRRRPEGPSGAVRAD